jgi:hypothetical protein
MFRLQSGFTRLAGMPLIVSMALTLSGCAGTPVLDSRFGDSVRQASAQQTLFPDAGRNTAPVLGIDGRAGDGAYESYQKSYKTPEPQQNVFLIGGQSR